MNVCMQPSINNEEATVSFDITAVTTTIAVSMLLAANCCTNQKKKTQPGLRGASAHLVICLVLSLRFPVFPSIRLSSFLCPFSLIHHFLNHSSPLPAYIPSPSRPPVIPSAFLASVCLLLWCFSLLTTVASRLLSPSVLFFVVVATAMSHTTASMSPSWRSATLATAGGYRSGG